MPRSGIFSQNDKVDIQEYKKIIKIEVTQNNYKRKRFADKPKESKLKKKKNIFRHSDHMKL